MIIEFIARALSSSLIGGHDWDGRTQAGVGLSRRFLGFSSAAYRFE